ncbi:hypothetical protein P9112_007295 [Eukaryota sp. TZLM1-RC]
MQSIKSVVVYFLYVLSTVLILSSFLSSSNRCFPDHRHEPPPGPLYDHTFLLIVDALSFDTAIKHLRSTSQLSHSINTSFIPLYANFPTITVTAITTMMTGRPAALFDVSKMFTSTRITDDNLIDAAFRSNKNLHVVGDDVWGDLFPQVLNNSSLLPSFDINDFNSIDNLVYSEFSQLQLQEFDLIIGHLLGVDHIGHTKGQNSQEMIDKLMEIDQFIVDFYDKLPKKSLLLILSDHGMDVNGNHGGGSELERKGVFLTLPSRDILTFKDLHVPSFIRQSELTSFLSIAIGVNCPFCNQGLPILLKNNSKLIKSTLAQIHNYLNSETNSLYFSYFSSVYLKILKTNDTAIFQKLLDELRSILHLIEDEATANFSHSKVLIGLVILSNLHLTFLIFYF